LDFISGLVNRAPSFERRIDVTPAAAERVQVNLDEFVARRTFTLWGADNCVH
jgi:hypothetical protein